MIFAFALLLVVAHSAPTPIPLDFTPGRAYDGIGALSGGGGVTRLLIDYPEALQSDILDILFKPKAGASLDIIKVEIGGDTQSTEGTELSHQHTRTDLNCTRGYEWYVLKEAKARNPAIKTYGLAWGVPGWIGDGNVTSAPGNFYSDDNIEYHLSWLDCARNTWGIEIDLMGIWNERGSDPTWTIQLRNAMDAAGYMNTRIVSADTSWDPVTTDVATNAAFAAAVDIIGAHYPGQPPALAYTLNKTLFASEMWNLGSVDDWDGAMVLAEDLTNQAQWGLSASILWCLIFSWYAPLPFSRVIPGTNAGAGHSILTAAEPWSGNYQLNPQIHAMAHHTQFASPGWVYLPMGSPGMSGLPGGGGMVTRFNPRTPAGELDFSITLHTAKANGPQDVVFTLPPGTPNFPPALHVWFTNATTNFVQLGDVVDGGGGSYAITLAPNAMYSITTTTGQSAPTPSQPIPPSAPFPFPYSDDFNSYLEGAYAKYTCDEGGAFVVKNPPSTFTSHPGNTRREGVGAGAMFQLVTKVPIVWEKNPDPYTLLGNFNEGGWQDYSVEMTMAIDPSATPSSPPSPTQDTQAAITNTCSGGAGKQGFNTAAANPPGGAGGVIPSNFFSGFCLGFTGSTLYPGAMDVGLVPCASAPKWLYNTASQQLQVLGGPSMCLDVDGGNSSAGARLLTYECKSPADPTGNKNQKWMLSGSAIESALDTPPLCVDLEAVAPSPSSALPYLSLSMRIGKYERNGPPPSGYTLKLTASPNATVAGQWELNFGTNTLKSGATPSPILPGVWYDVKVQAAGNQVTAFLGGSQLVTLADTSSAYGMVAFGSGWHEAWFENLAIKAV